MLALYFIGCFVTFLIFKLILAGTKNQENYKAIQGGMLFAIPIWPVAATILLLAVVGAGLSWIHGHLPAFLKKKGHYDG